MLDAEHLYARDGSRDDEVCMAIRRPNGRLIVMTKPFYPEGTWRLPTGGVEPGEEILEALHREVVEETGLDVEVSRYLAVIDYSVEPRPEVVFRTHAFLLEEVGGTLASSDPGEFMEFREVRVDDLPAMAKQLESLPETPSNRMGDSWAQWGRFRAIAQRTVHEALTGSIQ